MNVANPTLLSRLPTGKEYASMIRRARMLTWIRLKPVMNLVAVHGRAAPDSRGRAKKRRRTFARRPSPEFGANQARRKAALRRRRTAKPIAPKPINIIAHVAGSGTAATTPADVALTKLEVNGPVVLIR